MTAVGIFYLCKYEKIIFVLISLNMILSVLFFFFFCFIFDSLVELLCHLKAELFVSLTTLASVQEGQHQLSILVMKANLLKLKYECVKTQHSSFALVSMLASLTNAPVYRRFLTSLYSFTCRKLNSGSLPKWVV